MPNFQSRDIEDAHIPEFKEIMHNRETAIEHGFLPTGKRFYLDYSPRYGHIVFKLENGGEVPDKLKGGWTRLKAEHALLNHLSLVWDENDKAVKAKAEEARRKSNQTKNTKKSKEPEKTETQTESVEDGDKQS